MNKLGKFLMRIAGTPAGAVALVILLFIILRYISSLFESPEPEPEPEQVDTNRRGTEGLSTREGFNARAIAQSVYSEMKGLTFSCNHLPTLLELNDLELIHVFNQFNSLYYKEGKGNLRNWVQDEWHRWGGNCASMRSQLINKFDYLNI